MLKVIFIVLLFFIGLYVMANYSAKSMRENFDNSESSCPDLLIQKGNAYFLKNSKLAEIPGVNPIRFNNLDEYVQFMEWQRSQGIQCPVLYLQQSENTQGESVYKIRPDPQDLQGGLAPQPGAIGNNSNLPINSNKYVNSLLYDANHTEYGVYNREMYPAFDPENQYVGEEVPLDKIYNEGQMSNCSANPMDPNWCGPKYSESRVAAGDYKGNEVYIKTA